MDENQNGTYGGETPRTYGEESKLYENGGIQDADDGQQNGKQVNPYQQSYGNQPEYQQNAYGQSYGSQPEYQQNPYQQSYESQAGGQQNSYQQPYGGQVGNQQNPYGQPYGSQPGSQQNSYGQPYGSQPGSQQNPYQQPYMNPYQQPYGNQPYYGNQPVSGSVRDVFCYILLVIMPLRILVSFPILKEVFTSYESVMSGQFSAISTAGPYAVFSALSNLLLIAYIIFVILDIVNVHKGGYKITGLILFEIFLNPGYYIWRAYVLKRPKTVPIIYTVAYAILMAGYFIYAFYLSFSMMLNILT